MNRGLPSESGVSVVGRYALYEKKIASGGMATVHLGRLLGPVGFARTVAIKRLHPHLASDPDLVSMFIDEARLAARIRHPNVVPTLDVVATSGELFLVMEYVAGESLSRLLRAGGAVPLPIVSAIMSGVLYGLDAAHEAKSELGQPLHIVHRDVSPQNILVGADGIAKILDFGVAKAVGQLNSTQQGQVKGKLSYLAPEQLRGEPATRQADVYAAGVVLWEAITGRRLFVADNEGAVMTKILEGQVQAPSKITASSAAKATLSDRTFRGFERLEWVVMRALDRDPVNRFERARDMAREIERAIPPATPSDVGHWVEQTARDVLTERATLVGEIESRSSLPEAHEIASFEATLPLGATREATMDETMRDHRPAHRSTAASPAPDVSRPALDELAESIRGRAAAPPPVSPDVTAPMRPEKALYAPPGAQAPPGAAQGRAPPLSRTVFDVPAATARISTQGVDSWMAPPAGPQVPERAPAATARISTQGVDPRMTPPGGSQVPGHAPAPAASAQPPRSSLDAAFRTLPLLGAPGAHVPVVHAAPPDAAAAGAGSAAYGSPHAAPQDESGAAVARRWIIGIAVGLAGAACIAWIVVTALHFRPSRSSAAVPDRGETDVSALTPSPPVTSDPLAGSSAAPHRDAPAASGSRRAK